MHPVVIVTYQVKPVLGIPVIWVTEILHVVDRQLFVDEQRSGPYRLWGHQHHLREVAGGAEAPDVFHYALPFGPAGDWSAVAERAPAALAIDPTNPDAKTFLVYRSRRTCLSPYPDTVWRLS